MTSLLNTPGTRRLSRPGWRQAALAALGMATLALSVAVAAGAPAELAAGPALAGLLWLGLACRAAAPATGEAAGATVTHAYLHGILGSMLDGLVVVTPEGRIEMVNAAACRLTGWEEAELIGQPVTCLIPQATPSPAGRSDPARFGVDRVQGRDGRSIPALASLSVMQADTGEARIVCVFRDIAELRQREAELQAAKEQAEVASQAKSRFLANMSHELRTPLNAILGFAEVMRDEILGPIAPRYRGYNADIHASGQHLLSIINDVLDLSKIEAGCMTPVAEPTDVAGTVDAVLRLLTVRAETDGLHLESLTPRDLPPLHADPRMLRQILLNLVGNAVKFNRPGGRVTVRAWVAVDGGLELAVADTGIGMHPDDIPRALTPFVQVDGSPLGRRFAGTGLGLPLALAMVSLHDGTLTIDSRLGVGTEVLVRFPPGRWHGDAKSGLQRPGAGSLLAAGPSRR